MMCRETSVTTLIGLTPLPHSAGTGLALFRKALVGGVAYLFVANFAEAAPFDGGFAANSPPAVNAPARKKPARSSTASKATKKDEAKNTFGEMPKGPLQMVVSIGQQHVTLYSNGVRIAQSPVSTGTPGHPTPTGVFSVIEKDRWHRSNLYNSAPMYYMQRLTWSGVAMHEGMLPGFAASHGCIRMPTAFGSKLWVTTKLGVRVVVARSDVTPYEFSHSKLFNPAPKPSEAKLQENGAVDTLRPTIATDNSPAPAARRSLQVAQASTITNDASKEADSADQLPVLPAPINEAAPPAPTQPAQQSAVTAEPDVETTATTPASEAPKAAPVPGVVRPAAAQIEPAMPVTEPANSEPAKSEPPKPNPIRARIAEAKKRSGQVAVFVSKKEKKIFVRYALVPIFDMPIEIANPEQPLGTHVFTAMELIDDGAGMRWNAITMPFDPSRSAAVETSSKSKKGARKEEPAPRKPVEVRQPSTAQQALDRVNLPPEAVELISELLNPGSSMVISDEGLGKETGRYTEFIVLTR